MSILQTGATECREQRVTLAEFILDGCGNEFGTAPCAATGEPCYNTYNTCKDKCNFTCEAKTFWFSTCQVPPQIVAQFVPNIVDVSATPTTLEIGKAFSTRGRVKLCMRDAPHNDLGFDPYWPRGAIPICPEDKAGTLMSRWIKRVKYFENRRVNLYHGYTDQPLCEWTKETFFIEKVDKPGSDGTVCFTLKDPLILAEDKTAKCPRQDNKLIATQVAGNEFRAPFLLAGILEGPNDPNSDTQSYPYARVGQLLLDNNFLIGNDEQDRCFSRIRHVCIGDEVLEVRPVPNNATPAGWNLQLVNRGVCGSEISEHKANSQIRLAETFEKEHVSDVICRLLTECAQIEEVASVCCVDEADSLIGYDSLLDFRCQNPMAYVNAIICEPEGITTLLNELSEQFHFFIYYDSTTDRIKVQSLRPPECDYEPIVIEHCDYVGDISPKTGDDRYNEISFFHDVANCAESLEKNNTLTTSIVLSADALREPCDRREWKTRRAKEIESRWIDECNTYVALTSGERWSFIRNCASETIKIQTTFQAGECLEYGQYVKVRHSQLQDIHGNPSDELWFLKSKSTAKDCTTIQFENAAYFDNMRACFDCNSECAYTLQPADECSDDCVGIW